MADMTITDPKYNAIRGIDIELSGMIPVIS